MAAQSNLPVHEYSPAKVKRAVGAGGADGKEAVTRMVQTFLQLTKIERADASDALAVAICHLNHGRTAARAVGSTKRGRRNPFSVLGDRLAPAYRRFGTHG